MPLVQRLLTSSNTAVAVLTAQPSGSTTSPNQTTQDSSANSQAAVICRVSQRCG
jgi:hypothetical protein